MAFSYNDCVSEGLLRKIPPSREQAFRSIERSEKWLKEAEKTFESEAFDSSVLASYMVMFHAARAILFLDGFREKSHVCVARYLEERYVKTKKLKKKWVDLLDHHREIRHNDQYDLSFFSTDEDAQQALQSASEFLGKMKELLNSLVK